LAEAMGIEPHKRIGEGRRPSPFFLLGWSGREPFLDDLWPPWKPLEAILVSRFWLAHPLDGPFDIGDDMA